MSIILSLNTRDARPLHEQVREGLRRLIVSGAIREQERLPAVRELAITLSINPNTIARAYRDLETEGYIYTVTGKGSFAADRQEVNNDRLHALLAQWEDITRELLFLGKNAGELCTQLQAMGGSTV